MVLSWLLQLSNRDSCTHSSKLFEGKHGEWSATSLEVEEHCVEFLEVRVAGAKTMTQVFFLKK